MKKDKQVFFDYVRDLVSSKQPIASTEIKAVPELPGDTMCMYTDTVALKSEFDAIQERVYKEANKLDFEIAFDLPTVYNGQPVESIDKNKRYLSIAIYDKQILNEPIAIND